MRWIISVAAFVALLATLVTCQETRTPSPSLLKTSFGKLPIYFVENRGLFPDEVMFYVQGADKTLFFTRNGITFRLKGKDRGWVVKLEFVGANPDVELQGEDRQETVFSYFTGPEKDWKTGLPSFSKIVYRDLWPGVDLVYRGTAKQLKYEFVVKPGVDPGKIRLRYRGATSVILTGAGALKVETPEGGFADEPPVAWQEIDSERVPVDMVFTLPGKTGERGREFGFCVGKYDSTKPLILDPAILVYCGYIGGSGSVLGDSIAVDAAGNAYVTGSTWSSQPSFPVKAGPDLTFNGVVDAFVAKVNPQGTALVYCGYLGGASSDYGRGIAVDPAGNAYVTGNTQSQPTTFPVKVGPDMTYNGGSDDAFVAKVNASGTALVYCGYIGGAASDIGWSIAVDPAGNACVTGYTPSPSTSFPVKAGPDLTFNGGINDAFVAKVNAQGTGLVYCGYIGGSNSDAGYSIAVDRAGNAYVTGSAFSTQATFPVTVGPDLTYNGGNPPNDSDTFVAKVNAQGTALVYCGYIGGAVSDYGWGIAVDPAGNAYVTGGTYSSMQQGFPVIVGPDLNYKAGYDAFVAKVNAQGTALDYCGYIGGNDSDAGRSIAVDPAGNAYVTGSTQSSPTTFPVKVGPDLTYNGGCDAFVARVNAQGSGLVFCGYIGGAAGDQGYGIALDTIGNAYVTGNTWSSQPSFPVKAGPDLTFNGVHDAFVAKVGMTTLQGSGAPRPGGTVSLQLSAPGDAALPYQVGSSLGTGPIPIGKRQLGLSPDDLLVVSAMGYWPWVFSSYRGAIDSMGQAKATINIPNIPALIGQKIHTAFVTQDPQAPSGIRSISNTFSFTITK